MDFPENTGEGKDLYWERREDEWIDLIENSRLVGPLLYSLKRRRLVLFYQINFFGF